MDTSKFTSNKEGGDGYRDYRKACQSAFADINAVLEPKPKINKIMVTADMGQAIVDKIGGCVGVDAEGNPVWTDPRAGSLKPETIELYSFLVSPEGMAQMGMTAPEPAANPNEGAADPALAEGPKFLADDQECPGWVNKTGPDARYKETCDACSRNEACAAQVAKPKAAAKASKEPKVPKEPKTPKVPSERYGYVHAFRDAIRSGGMSRKDLIAKTLELYLAKGHTGDLKQAERNVDTFLRPLFILEFVAEENGVISLVG